MKRELGKVEAWRTKPYEVTHICSAQHERDKWQCLLYYECLEERENRSDM